MIKIIKFFIVLFQKNITEEKSWLDRRTDNSMVERISNGGRPFETDGLKGA